MGLEYEAYMSVPEGGQLLFFHCSNIGIVIYDTARVRLVQ